MVLCTFYDFNLFNMVAIFFSLYRFYSCAVAGYRVGLRKCEPFFGIIGAFLTFSFWSTKLGQRSYFYTPKVKILES